MKERMNQMFKDKLFLVMLVLGLLTIVAAAGVVTMNRGDGQEQNPYVEMQGQENLLAGETQEESQISVAGESNARSIEDTQEKVAKQEANPDTVVQEKTKSSGENTSPKAQAVGTGMEAAKALVLDFSDTSRVSWPVMGNVVLDYSMDSTIYFPTLDQYK